MRLFAKYHQARRGHVTERQLHVLFNFHAPYNNHGNLPVAMGYNPTVNAGRRCPKAHLADEIAPPCVLKRRRPLQLTEQ